VGTKEEAIKKKTNDDTPRRRLIGEGSVIEMFGANIGFTFFDDYAVLKVDSFSIAYSDVVAAWKALTDAAAARGITKLLVDVIHSTFTSIASNLISCSKICKHSPTMLFRFSDGGGDPAAGYLLASYMYPDAAWDDLSNPYDVSTHMYRSLLSPLPPSLTLTFSLGFLSRSKFTPMPLIGTGI